MSETICPSCKESYNSILPYCEYCRDGVLNEGPPMSETKPREFWVCAKKMEAGGFYYAEDKEKQPDLYPHYIHVIEYKAYLELVETHVNMREILKREIELISQERDEYKAALERLCDQIEVAGDFMEFSRSMNKPCIINHVSFAKNSSKNARAVLKKWSKPEGEK